MPAPDAAVRDELARLCLLLLASNGTAGTLEVPAELPTPLGAGAVELLDRALAAGK